MAYILQAKSANAVSLDWIYSILIQILLHIADRSGDKIYMVQVMA